QEYDQAHHKRDIPFGGLHLKWVPTCRFSKADVEIAATKRHDQYLHALILVPNDACRTKLLGLSEQHSLQYSLARAGHADNHGVAWTSFAGLVQIFRRGMEVEEERAACLGFEQGNCRSPGIPGRLADQLIVQAGKAQKVK